ncbi:MAG: hypothetical protein ACD_37C00596G0005 [uncultured bacterium]|nr:MAG: hypothetical protein ACD_37C00596G0005 [uncultured bacterium]
MNNKLKKGNKVVSRFYNKLLFTGDTVIKGAPKDRHFNEINWFMEASKRIPNNIPKILNYEKKLESENPSDLKYYEMQAVKGDNLYQYLSKNNNKTSEILDKIIAILEIFHKESLVPNEDDIYEMYLFKPKLALQEFITSNSINPEDITINGQKYSYPIEKLERTYNDLKKQLMNSKYSFMHGDLTLSNILIDKNNDLYLIDPRGKFGTTSVFGDIRYDISKMYYSFVGMYDSLNDGNFKYGLNNKTESTYTYNIDGLGLDSYGEYLLNYFDEKRDLIRFIHSTIWLSLIPHVKETIEQQYCTFCHGIYLLNTIYD